MKSSGCQDVDYSLTTREAARMLKEKGIDLREMPEEEFDDPLGISTGAAAVWCYRRSDGSCSSLSL